MVERKRSSGKPVQYNTALHHRALLIRAIELLLTLFYKKTHPDKLAHIKKWEREKIVNLGLADYPLPPKTSPAKDISFTSWDSEKVSNFGLTGAHAVKNAHRSQHQPKEKLSDTNLTPKIAPVQIKKKSQTQIGLKNDNAIDDFFKILGYE